MAKRGLGTIAFRDSWDILIKSWFRNRSFKNFSTLSIGKRGYTINLFNTNGQYKGYPKRHSETEVGFSDHFPVYIYLIKEVK
jgi:hypothetical protein